VASESFLDVNYYCGSNSGRLYGWLYLPSSVYISIGRWLSSSYPYPPPGPLSSAPVWGAYVTPWWASIARLRRVRKNQNTPTRMARETTGMQTPIAALAPVDSPLDGLGVPVEVLEAVDVAEDWVLVTLLDSEAVDVIVEAADSTTASEACHQMGIPSQATVVVARIELVVTVPRFCESPACVG
jgi:hypothetical protein